MSDKGLVGKRFSKVAKTYEEYAVVQRKVAETLADILMEKCEEERENKNTPPPSRCFEIGCGSGFLTKALRVILPTILPFPNRLLMVSVLWKAMLKK